MKNKDRIILKKIVRYCDDIHILMDEYETDYTHFVEKISFQYACNMCIIQIGELVGRLSEEFVSEHSTIPWRAIKAMRNLHAHDYERVDLEIVWDTLVNEIPKLKEYIEQAMEQINA